MTGPNDPWGTWYRWKINTLLRLKSPLGLVLIGALIGGAFTLIAALIACQAPQGP